MAVRRKAVRLRVLRLFPRHEKQRGDFRELLLLHERFGREHLVPIEEAGIEIAADEVRVVEDLLEVRDVGRDTDDPELGQSAMQVSTKAAPSHATSLHERSARSAGAARTAMRNSLPRAGARGNARSYWCFDSPV